MDPPSSYINPRQVCNRNSSAGLGANLHDMVSRPVCTNKPNPCRVRLAILPVNRGAVKYKQYKARLLRGVLPQYGVLPETGWPRWTLVFSLPVSRYRRHLGGKRGLVYPRLEPLLFSVSVLTPSRARAKVHAGALPFRPYLTGPTPDPHPLGHIVTQAHTAWVCLF